MSDFKLKKFFIMMTAFAVPAVFAFLVVSCFGSSDDSTPAATSLVGLWKATQVVVNGVNQPNFGIDETDCNKDDTVDVIYTGIYYFQLGSNNKSRDYQQYTAVDDKGTGGCGADIKTVGIHYCSGDDKDYKVEGNKIITGDGSKPDDTNTYAISGNTMTMTGKEENDVGGYDDLVITWEKVADSAVAGAVDDGC